MVDSLDVLLMVRKHAFSYADDIIESYVEKVDGVIKQSVTLPSLDEKRFELIYQEHTDQPYYDRLKEDNVGGPVKLAWLSVPYEKGTSEEQLQARLNSAKYDVREQYSTVLGSPERDPETGYVLTHFHVTNVESAQRELAICKDLFKASQER